MRGERTRARILEGALRLFQEKGIAETSMADIERVAGVSKGALYFHFASKEELALAVLAKARNEFTAFLREAFSQGPPRRAFGHFLNMIYRRLSEGDFRTGCLFGNTAIEVANRKGPIRDFLEDTFQEWREALADVFRRAQERGCLSRKISPEDMALFVIAALEGGILLARLKKDGGPLSTVNRILENLLPFDEGGQQ
ncbi:TetR/AcrR family transcriptional regulator [Thermosulfurimonas sp. F29]|uniref:TetR/AcrR family transcriptional regulator n=1 Tax=Thermosulfurimonas sp. F29 TaxID=2867247 RepID=UPI001C836FAE|nr:TetR/AcrR family transcriptional regulator [Thermosulfurimonas sp. F29]MBX6422356.1 TetR/AcrR family transcriptional regulator [Thermosulfurimonas sp. F29]